MTFVLIILSAINGPVAVAGPFDSAVACENAALSVVEAFPGAYHSHLTTHCMPMEKP